MIISPRIDERRKFPVLAGPVTSTPWLAPREFPPFEKAGSTRAFPMWSRCIANDATCSVDDFLTARLPLACLPPSLHS
ncbi:hypothetical protein BCEP4_220182 [Burkholderia cepacia]|nr:hypothetical protein BCEP4_220182 [Burkholderia cepacia]